MGYIVDNSRATRFPPSGPRGWPNDPRSFMADLRELEQAILALQKENESLKERLTALGG